MPEEALKREVREETGLDVEILQPLRIWSFFKNNGKTQVVGATMLCKYKGGEVRLSKEHNEYAWVDPEEIDNYNVHEGIKKDVKEAVKIMKRM